MSTILFPVSGYRYLYRSLLRFSDIKQSEAMELVYLLNTSNLDTLRYHKPFLSLQELPFVAFFKSLERTSRPYRTEIQLYKSLETLVDTVSFHALMSHQREAVSKAKCILSNLEFDFYKTFGIEIDSPLTVYSACKSHLIPSPDEPSVCLMEDWLLFPTA